MKLWLNVAEGAECAGVCRDLIYDACAARRMHHIRVGGRRAIRLKREWIDAWLERHVVIAQDGPLPVLASARTSQQTIARNSASTAVPFRAFSMSTRPQICCGRHAAPSTRWSSDTNCLASCACVAASCSAPTFC